ncbi:hypothetical protein TDB9533_00815 [Thalassocella blandensis]|nr:hypothetical protein TDB9533_00815 [Thalassocella blandensis]
MATTLVCDGTVTQTSDGLPLCSTGWMTQLASVPFDISQVDPGVASAFFAGGFALLIIPWSVAWGFRQMFKLIPKR